MHKPVILVAESDRFSTGAVATLRTVAEVRLADLGRAELICEIASVDVLWVRLRHRIDGEVLGAAPRLRWLVTATTGLNHIDLGEAASRGIHVLSLRGETDFLMGVRATAEHTICLILALLRHIPQAASHVGNGGWNRDEWWGHELHDKTAGVIGYGRLGRLVAHCLMAFGMRVLACDPAKRPNDVEEGVELMSLQDMLSRADLVTLHVNLTPQTEAFFGATEFERLKKGAWFINTARGELVDESALLSALETGRLAGAALDVLARESSTGMGEHPLVRYARTHCNLLITPHIGGCTYESVQKTEEFLAGKLVWALSAGPERA